MGYTHLLCISLWIAHPFEHLKQTNTGNKDGPWLCRKLILLQSMELLHLLYQWNSSEMELRGVPQQLMACDKIVLRIHL